MANRHLIFCIESTDKNPNDKYYIDALIKNFYIIGENKISFIGLGGKYRYNNPKIPKEISRLKKATSDISKLEVKVIYCLDKDASSSDPQDRDFINQVTEYCMDNGYDIIWFVRTIEEVMNGKTASQREKHSSAVDFVKKKKATQLNTSNLNCSNNVNAKKKSNILTVIDKYLVRKNN